MYYNVQLYENKSWKQIKFVRVQKIHNKIKKLKRRHQKQLWNGMAPFVFLVWKNSKRKADKQIYENMA